MEIQSRNRKNQYRSALYTERAGLAVRVIPVLMGLAALFTVFFTGIHFLLGKPMQWLVMLGAMVLTFFLFTVAFLLARRDHVDIAVYIVVIALNLLGAGGALALEGWFAMSILLAYVGIACARLLTGRAQNWIVVELTTIGIVAQIMMTYFGPITKYANPAVVQILLWMGYAISGLFVVAFILDIQDQYQEQLLVQAEDATDQLQAQTTTLEKQTVTLQRRTDFLVKMIQVIQDLGNQRQLVDLVDKIVQSIQKEFGFYHVAYYKVSGPLAPAVLLDAAGEVAAEWKDKNFQVMLDAQDPIAEVARLGRYVLSAKGDQSTSRTAAAQSRVTIPLHTTQSGVTGVLDIQDREVDIFQEGEMLLLQNLGEQISVALEDTLRFEDVNQRLEGALRVSREGNLASWREWMRTSPNLAYRYYKDRTTVAELPGELEDDELPSLLTEHIIPLTTVHGETLGQVTAHKMDSWTAEEITLIGTLIEQVEQTLENARLYQVTQRRATREQMTRGITDSIRSAVTVEDAIRRAVTELAQVVDASEVAVQLNVAQGAQPAQGDGDE